MDDGWNPNYQGGNAEAYTRQFWGMVNAAREARYGGGSMEEYVQHYGIRVTNPGLIKLFVDYFNLIKNGVSLINREDLIASTSMGAPPYPPWTHSKIIRQAFSTSLDRHYVNSIIKGSKLADAPIYQQVQFSYMHSMLASVSQKLSDALDLRQGYIDNEVRSFIQSAQQDNFGDAYEHLGMAMHPLMDEWSPMHEGWPVWNPKDSIPHFLGEAFTSHGVEGAVHSIKNFFDYAISELIRSLN